MAENLQQPILRDITAANRLEEQGEVLDSGTPKRCLHWKYPEELSPPVCPDISARKPLRLKLVQRASGDGLGRSISSVSSLIESYTADLDAASPVQHWVKEHLHELEGKMETLLQQISEELAQEVEREQQHLMLMQDQVDKQGQIISREVVELRKKLDHESTRHSFVSSSVRESKEALVESLERQERELEALRSRLADLEAPLYMRVVKGAVKFWWSGCWFSPASLLPARAYSRVQSACSTPTKPVLPE